MIYTLVSYIWLSALHPVVIWRTAATGFLFLFFYTSPIHSALSRWKSCALEEEKFSSASVPALEIVTEPQQKWDSLCVNGKAGSAGHECVALMAFSLTTKSSDKREMSHNPQSNVTTPNNLNVVATGVLSILYVEEIQNFYMVILSLPLLFVTFLPRNIRV